MTAMWPELQQTKALNCTKPKHQSSELQQWSFISVKLELTFYELSLGCFTAACNFLRLTDGASEVLWQKWETDLLQFVF